MDRKIKIYIGILLVISVIVSITYFSYAFFFKKDEIHGYLNYVVGTLNYKIESESLTNNQITVPAGTVSELVINLTSLNDIETDYKLYYETDNSEIEVGYTEDTTDMPNGTIGVNEVKTIKILIKNKTASSATITFSVKGGFVDKEFTVNGTAITEQLTTCMYDEGKYWEFAYTGNVQTFSIPCIGTYQLEVWGAQGGGVSGSTNSGGYGGYSIGNTSVDTLNNFYVVVGGAGLSGNAYNSGYSGGYNGGGAAYPNGDTLWGSGGGATHIAKELRGTGVLAEYSSYRSDLLIVAGGGGGAGKFSGSVRTGGTGGGTTGGSGIAGKNNAATGGTQSSGGSASFTNNETSWSVVPGFGTGGSFGRGSGGGGGYYGGGAGYYYGSSAGGGSGYIGGVTNASTTNGQRSGSGYAKITYLGD